MTSLITGCITKTEYVKVPIHIPENMYSCESPSLRPSGDPIMESEVAKYIASLEKTIPDCKLRLKEIRVILECYNDKECDPKSLMRGLTVARESLSG